MSGHSAETEAGQRERVAEALYDYLLGKYKPREWPAPEQHLPWWYGLADVALTAASAPDSRSKAHSLRDCWCGMPHRRDDFL